ncbi:MAG: hypothetical protein DMF93_21510, partial [Acidobacteria bacterium]
MRVKQSFVFAGLAAAALATPFVLSSSTSTLSATSARLADTSSCNLSQYKSAPGLTAAVEQDSLVVSWTGQNGADLRARYAIDGGQPEVREIAVKKAGGRWTTLGRNLTPEYHVVSGVRRMADDQANPLRAAGIELTEDVINKHRWYAFWDAPLVMPGSQEMKDEAAWQRSQQQPEGGGGRGGRGGQTRDPLVPNRTLGTPRTPSEIRRADASFHTTSCSVKTDGASLIVTFPGLSMGIFSGDLQFTMYKGTNLIRMDAAATTHEEWVAYKYDAGLKGLSTDLTPRVAWRDTGGHPQEYRFGGLVNPTLARVKAQNRLIAAEARGGALVAFPPPHTFFFTREKDTNLGYAWYRKDADGRFGFGVGMPEREEEPRYAQNFALYNAPPGTVQKMGVYFYASPD